MGPDPSRTCMNGGKKQRIRTNDRFPASPDDIALREVLRLIIAVVMVLFIGPFCLYAQDAGLQSGPANGTGETAGLSGSGSEKAVQPSGMEVEPVNLSPFEGENLLIPGSEETMDLSPAEGEALIGPPAEGEFALPEIAMPDYAELYDLSPSEAERAVFAARPRDPFYEEVVAGAPEPDVTRLGPLPEIKEEGVEFTDVAADWIYYQKSAGLTELRGHVMVVYDTTIISSDEATLDETNEIYKFFGEGRVFVDDKDFTLECDELEIHDSEDEKTIYMRGSSTMLVYADKDAKPPGEDSTKRQRLEYALKQQDTTITFTDAEYNYDKDIFDAHGGVRFEQTDKYAQGDEFHGENETEYALFEGSCEFWQKDGKWLYDNKVVEDKESPPSRGDKITRALLSVPTKVTCDEAETKGKDGWMQLRSSGGNVVYFHQDDKHAECEKFTLWYTEEEEQKKTEVEEPPRNLLEEPVVAEEEEPQYTVPPGFGTLRPASDFPTDWVPWEPGSTSMGEGSVLFEGIIPGTELPRLPGVIPSVPPGTVPVDLSDVQESTSKPEGENLGSNEGAAASVGAAGPTESGTPGSAEASEGANPVAPVEEPQASEPVETATGGEAIETSGPVGSIAELGEEGREAVTGAPVEEPTGPRDEIIMEGNVFARQENGNWLFDYDIVDEEKETEESIEQYRKWANASCDYFQIWTRKEIVEATGAVSGEQDNQNLASDFLRYLGKLEMMYLRGNVVVHREGKHEVLSNEAFLFFSTKVFEALGAVQTKLMVDVEEQRTKSQGGTEEGQGETGGAEGEATGGQ